MICAACGDSTEAPTCGECGQSALLDGRYRLEGRIGIGGTGTTWRASTMVDGRAHSLVAVKELPVGSLDSAKARELVEREIRVLRELDHAAIPRYWEDLFVGKGRSKAVYIVQDFVDGETLADEVKHRRYTEGEVVALMAELLHVLSYLHGLRPPVVHRDLKPQNVIRRKDGRLALIDFGSVRDSVKGELGGSTVAGTFGYMAPEQFRGDASPVSDLYGLGALAIALLSRREPHALLDWSGRLKWEEVTFVTKPMGELLGKLLAPDPLQRPQSAVAVLAELAELNRRRASYIRGPQDLASVDAEERRALRPILEQISFVQPATLARREALVEPLFGPVGVESLVRVANAVERVGADAGQVRNGKAFGAAFGMVFAFWAAVALVVGLSAAAPAASVGRTAPTYVWSGEPGTVICTSGTTGAAGAGAPAMFLARYDTWCTVHVGDKIGGFDSRLHNVSCDPAGYRLVCNGDTYGVDSGAGSLRH